jgi:hypothetical protein
MDTLVDMTLCVGETDYDTKLYVYEGSCPQPGTGQTGTDLACNDDACDNPPFYYNDFISAISNLYLRGGVPYYIVVDGYGTNCGNYSLQITIDPCQYETTPPIAEITIPTEIQCVCTEQIVEGSAFDPDGTFDSYTLEYRRVGDVAWTYIYSSTEPVVNDVLALWDTTGLSSGYYFLRLLAYNTCGLMSTVTQLVWLDTQFDSLIIRYPVGGEVVGGNICLEGTVWDNRCFDHYTADYAPAGSGAFNPVDPLNPVYMSTVINDPFAHWDTVDLGVPDGNYDLRVVGTTDCGHSALETRRVTLDNTWPVAEIIDPFSCDTVEVDSMVPVIGTALDANLDFWVLEFTGGPASGWVPIMEGDWLVIEEPLAFWDTSGLPPCCYTLRLRVYDSAILHCNSPHRHRTDYMVSVRIAEPGGDFDVDDDGDVDLFDYSFFPLEFTGPD